MNRGNRVQLRAFGFCRWAAAALLTATFGCAAKPFSPTPLTAQPLGVQLLATEPTLHDEQFSELLGFETPEDLEFVSADAGPLTIDNFNAHTGLHSLAIPADATRVEFDLSTLLGSQSTINCTLIGSYFRVPKLTEVLICLKNGDTILAQDRRLLFPGRWSSAWVDVTRDPSIPSQLANNCKLIFQFPHGLGGAAYCDDLLLRENDQTLVDTTSDAHPGGWSIRTHGLATIVERPKSYLHNFAFIDGFGSGYLLEEYSPIRARFRAPAAPRITTLFADGRIVQDGALDDSYVDVTSKTLAQQSHGNPADLSVPENQGRIERNTPGDDRNIGYNPIWGAYEVTSFGRHVQITVNPSRGPVWKPVLEIAGLPNGKAVATLEGELIDNTCWLPNGHLLIELPALVQHTAVLDVRVQ